MNSIQDALNAAKNRADQSTQYSEYPIMETKFFSPMVIRSFIFEGERIAASYVTNKLRAARSTHQETAKLAVEECRTAARQFNYWRKLTALDIDPVRVADFKCGVNGNANINNTRAEQFAQATGVTIERAKQALAVQKVRMLQHSQSTYLAQHQAICSWISDLGRFGASDEGSTEAGTVIDRLQLALVEQYKRAASWLNLEEKVLIEGDAKTLEITLPSFDALIPQWDANADKVLAATTERSAAIESARTKDMRDNLYELESELGDF